MNVLIVKPQQMKSKNILIFAVRIKDSRLLSLRPICHTINSIRTDMLIVYGVQGESFQAAIADLGHPPKQDRRVFWLALCVMLTRAKSLESLLFLRMPPVESLSAGPPESVRLERIDFKSCITTPLHIYTLL